LILLFGVIFKFLLRLTAINVFVLVVSVSSFWFYELFASESWHVVLHVYRVISWSYSKQPYQH